MAGYRKLGRTSSQRKALLRNQVTNLLYHGKIVTTEAKAKEIRKIAEKLIAMAVKEKDNYETVTVKAKVAQKDKDGIHVLDENAPVGKDPLEYLGLKDTILDIGLTPNRADCMALTSLAYEVAAVLKRDVNLPEIKEKGMPGSSIEVKVETELCPFFGAKLVKGVTTKESPAWLKTALLASGIKPINNIVDISNYVMLET